jgi:hypothetical protein
MALNSNIIQNYGNGNVLIEIGSRNGVPKYYKVQESMADEFQREYISNSKKLQWASTGLLTAAIALFILPVSVLAKNLEKKTKMILGVASGVAGGFGSMAISNKLEKNSYSKLMQKYNAKEVDYKKPQT